jgi:hypothetical protein
MPPYQIAALGPNLLPWASEHTQDLNEAHYLVHEVVAGLTREMRSDPVALDEARTMMATVAQRHGFAGRIV